MQRFALGLLVAVLLSSPVPAQAYSDDRPADREYTQEDSNPLKFFSYILSPVGVALEYAIARPLHYLATQTALAPVIGTGNNDEMFGESTFGDFGDRIPAPIAELPPDLSAAPPVTEGSKTPLREENIRPERPSQPLSESQPAAPDRQAPAGQPVLH